LRAQQLPVLAERGEGHEGDLERGAVLDALDALGDPHVRTVLQDPAGLGEQPVGLLLVEAGQSLVTRVGPFHAPVQGRGRDETVAEQAQPVGIPGYRCDTKSHTSGEYTDWRSTGEGKTGRANE
jgi:hypothetical protein